MRRCFGCFSQLNDSEDVCPVCGFSLDKYVFYKWTLSPGTMLNDKYLIGKRLGEGGFGITYLAWDINLQTKVAIKEYYPSSFVTRDVTGKNGNYVDKTTTEEQGYDFDTGLKKYVMEASILSKFFDLPGIATVKDFFYQNGTAYIVMEYINGVSLKDYLKSNGGRLTALETVNLIKPVISSLSIVHKNKLLHRDISPDNIMIQKDGFVKLIDFGTARFFNNTSEDKSMTVMLKHGYAPIEQYSRNSSQSACTDVYALCAVMYRMITGSAPLEATERVQKDELIPIRRLARKTPKAIAVAIEKGLSVMPENRQQSMMELERELLPTKKDYIDKVSDDIYKVLFRVFAVVIVFLLVAVGLGAFYKINQRKIDEIVLQVNTVINSDEESDGPVADRLKEIEVDDRAEESIDVTAAEQENLNDTESNSSQMKETDDYEQVGNMTTAVSEVSSGTMTVDTDVKAVTSTPSVDEEKVLSQEEEEKISYAIMVVRDGVITGRGNESVTTGDIMDGYSEVPGEWKGFISPSDDVINVYYKGEREGETFIIEYSVVGDTFKVTAAWKNGNKIDMYSSFFDEILKTEGL